MNDVSLDALRGELAAQGIEAHVINPSSVAVSREHRRAKTDRLDTELLKRGFLGWLRGERGHWPVYVRLKAPQGIGSVQTFSGRHITIGEDRIVEMSTEDAD